MYRVNESFLCGQWHRANDIQKLKDVTVSIKNLKGMFPSHYITVADIVYVVVLYVAEGEVNEHCDDVEAEWANEYEDTDDGTLQSVVRESFPDIDKNSSNASFLHVCSINQEQ